MSSAAAIGRILSGKRPTRSRTAIRSLHDLEQAVALGFPAATLNNVVSYIATNRDGARRLRDQLVHPSMQKRRPARLPQEASARVERVARVMAAAEELWGNHADAQAFVATPHPLLAGRTPLEAAHTELGARQVEELILQTMHGVAL